MLAAECSDNQSLLELAACMSSDNIKLADDMHINFAYKEAGKQAVVQLRLCLAHVLQLNHKRNHELIKKHKREKE